MVKNAPRQLGISALLVLPIAILGGCGSSEKASPAAVDTKGVAIKVAVSTTVGSLQADIAAQEGFFAKHGLNAELVPLTNNTNLPTALGRQFDFGATYQPVVIKAVSSGIDIKAVAGGEIDSAAKPLIDIIVPADSPIKAPGDLAGKRIGSPAVNGIIHLLTLQWVKSAGADPASVTAVQVPFASMEDQLKQGRIDAVETAAPVQQKLIADGFRSLGDPAQALGSGDTMETIWASSGSWAADHKDVVQRFVAALSDADKFIAANEDAAVAALSKASGITLDNAKVIPIPAYRAALTAADIAPYATMMKGLGKLKDDSNPAQYLFASS